MISFIERVIEIHSNKYDYSLVEYKNMRTKVKIICPIHGIFEQTPLNHLYNKCGCPSCSNNKKLNTEDYKQIVNKIHNNYYDYSLVEYKNMHTKIKIICPIHGIFEQTPLNHLYNNCKKCSFDKLKISNINDRFNLIHDYLYNYNLVEYKNMRTKVKIICKKHGVFEQTPINHLAGKGCYKCSNNSKKRSSYFLSKVNELHNNKYQYLDLLFNKNSDKIKIICPIHGEFEQIVNNHLRGHGCPICSESKGEKEIASFLNILNINYVRQKRFDDCKDIRCLPFDFYIEKLNCCIEYDGIQHFKSIDDWGGDKYFEYIKRHDMIKNDYCKRNNIILIRISYKEIINEKLNELINFV